MKSLPETLFILILIIILIVIVVLVVDILKRFIIARDTFHEVVFVVKSRGEGCSYFRLSVSEHRGGWDKELGSCWGP